MNLTLSFWLYDYPFLPITFSEQTIFFCLLIWNVNLIKKSNSYMFISLFVDFFFPISLISLYVYELVLCNFNYYRFKRLFKICLANFTHAHFWINLSRILWQFLLGSCLISRRTLAGLMAFWHWAFLTKIMECLSICSNLKYCKVMNF